MFFCIQIPARSLELWRQYNIPAKSTVGYVKACCQPPETSSKCPKLKSTHILEVYIYRDMVSDQETLRTKMYVTKKLSSLRAAPHLMSLPPPDGPYSGIAVILDIDGVSGSVPLWNLPIPQNKVIGIGKSQNHIMTGFSLPSGISRPLMIIPVIDEPLSSNTYYVIEASSQHAGLALTCSSNGEFKSGAKNLPFNPDNINQQFKIVNRPGPGGIGTEMYAESLAIDASPPSFMTKNKWASAIAVSPVGWSCKLNEAEGQGLSESLRSALPDFRFSISVTSSEHVVVGRWYVPFIFVKEFGESYINQMRSSMYYKMSLEQRWEKIYETKNVRGDSASVLVDVKVKSEQVMLGGAVSVQGRYSDGVMRYEYVDYQVRGIGLSIDVVERMKWEQKRAGWVDVGEREVAVNESYFNGGGWRKFGCYVLVERFVLKRMSGGSVALSYDFYHIHQLRTKWE